MSLSSCSADKSIKQKPSEGISLSWGGLLLIFYLYVYLFMGFRINCFIGLVLFLVTATQNLLLATYLMKQKAASVSKRRECRDYIITVVLCLTVLLTVLIVRPPIFANGMSVLDYAIITVDV